MDWIRTVCFSLVAVSASTLGVFGVSGSPQASEAAAASGESHWIVFSSSRSGNGDLYAVRPSGGEVVKVAGSEAPEGTVRYDPTRDRLVYQRHHEKEGFAMLVADGKDLFKDPNGDAAPVWCPKSGRIAYVAKRDGQENLYIAAADGTEERALTQDAEVDRYPAWSPDGKHLVFARKAETGWDLFTIEVDGVDAKPNRLTRDGRYVGHPSWSPDGRYVAYDTLIDGQAEIMVFDRKTDTARRITERPGNDLVPSWAPDGRSLAYGADSDGNWDVWTVDLESLETRRITKDPAYDGGAVFVPGSALPSEARQ